MSDEAKPLDWLKVLDVRATYPDTGWMLENGSGAPIALCWRRDVAEALSKAEARAADWHGAAQELMTETTALRAQLGAAEARVKELEEEVTDEKAMHAHCDGLVKAVESRATQLAQQVEMLREALERRCWCHHGEDYWTTGERGEPHYVMGKHGYEHVPCCLSDVELAALTAPQGAPKKEGP